MTEPVHDLAIVGSSFGGSLLAAIARRMGLRVVLIERGRHPRFAIGESSTPITNLLLEEIASEFDLPDLATFAKWGSWQRHHPEIAVGLKRGFSFYHHNAGSPWRPRTDRANELLVAASPGDAIADTHWYRPEFDAHLARLAESLGAEYHDETELVRVDEEPETLHLVGTRHGQTVQFRCRFLVDASGPRGFLWKSQGLPESTFDSYPATESLFAHFRNVRRWDSLNVPGPTPPPASAPETPAENPPFPPDDAALHHVFPGGWMWMLRFNNGLTSAGVSLLRPLARELAIEEGAAAWQRLLQRFPTIAMQFESARVEGTFHHLPRLSFRSGVIARKRWALLPSAAGFVDPLLSTGFPLTLLGIQSLARMLRSEQVPSADALAQYSLETDRNLEFVAMLIGTLLANLDRPSVFQSVSMLYFAGATFSESGRRLGRLPTAAGFLLGAHPPFAVPVRELCELARRRDIDPAELEGRVKTVLEPFNIAGLADAQRRNWYPVDLAPLKSGHWKLGADWTEIASMLRRCGMAPDSVAD